MDEFQEMEIAMRKVADREWINNGSPESHVAAAKVAMITAFGLRDIPDAANAPDSVDMRISLSLEAISHLLMAAEVRKYNEQEGISA